MTPGPPVRRSCVVIDAVGSGTVTLSRPAPAPSELEDYRRELTGYCYRMLGSGFEAEDAVQETMLRAWRHAEGFEGRSSILSLIHISTAMYRAISERRLRPRRSRQAQRRLRICLLYTSRCV